MQSLSRSFLSILCVAAAALSLRGQTEEAKLDTSQPKPAQVSSFTPDEIAGYDGYAPALQTLVLKAAELTHKNLTYTFGSSDPTSGGMDCSGTIYHLLH